MLNKLHAKRVTVMFLALLLVCSFLFNTTNTFAAEVTKEVISEITCKPAFELKERQEIHVADAQGNQRDSYWQWLILDDGKQRFRILWGSPPISGGSVDLSVHQIYTFTISTNEEGNISVHTVSRILKGKEEIYAAKTSDSRKPEKEKR
jgi:hypothetical protein